MTTLLDRAVGLLWSVARIGAWTGGAVLFAVSALIAVEVLGRKFFAFSFEGVDEISGYALAIVSAWAFGYALLSRTHIRIDTLYVALPRRLQVMLDLLSLVAVVFFFGLATWFGWLLFLRSLEFGSRAMTPLQTPLAIPQGIWVAGLGFFVLTAVVLLLRAGLAFLRGDLGRAAGLAGSRTAAQEVAEEIEGAKALLAKEGAAS